VLSVELWDVLDEKGNKTGGTVERGQPMSQGDYHLVVHVWILNSNGEFLIQRRTPNKEWPGMWATTAGSAIVGDDSLAAALREVYEELGVTLDPGNGAVVTRITGHPSITDVWLFRQDTSVDSIVFQPGETDGAKLATPDEINKMIDEGKHIGREVYPYLDALFASVC